MPQVCHQCARANPAEAVYCHFDGAVLEGHGVVGGPVAVGSRPFPSPFVFPGGRACRCFDELALGCVAEWEAALEMLRDGSLATFFAALGRIDLAAAADEAARFPDPELGLDRLLGELPVTVLTEAKVRVAAAEVNLGVLDSEPERTFELELENQGLRLACGSVASSAPWLTLGDGPGAPLKHFRFLHESRLPVRVWPGRLRASRGPVEATLTVRTDAGEVPVRVRAEKKVRPFPPGPLGGLETPRQLAEAAQKRPREAAPLFESGEVERWYASNGWAYPVKAPAATGLAAIQQFFEALGVTKAPRVEIQPRELAASGAPGESLTLALEVSTREKRPVFAHAVSNARWLHAGKAQGDGKSVVLPLSIPDVPDAPGETLTAVLDVVANGNARWRVPVRLKVGSRSARQPVHSAAGRAGGPAWLPAVPAVLLAAALLAVVAYDLSRPPAAVEVAPQTTVAGPNYDPSLLRDPRPRLGVGFTREDRFGVVLLDALDPMDKGRWKRLTARDSGSTNNTVVKLGTSEYLFGYATPANRLTVSQEPLPAPYHGWRSIMDFSDEKVRVTQYLQFVPGQDNTLDTLLIYYRAYNYGTLPQKAALRALLDTYIGSNDGVPFTAPGQKGFVTTMAEYKRPAVPDYLEVVERPDDSADPGTIARVGLRGLAWGEVELLEPEAVRICRFPGAQMKWDWEMEEMRDDSCVAVYWPQVELDPRKTAHMAMTYGLGKLEISDRLALSARPAVQPGEVFVVTAYVYNAVTGQKVTLRLPEGLELAEGEAEQAVAEGGKRTQVFWRVRARAEGERQIEAVSGGARSRPVTVQVRRRNIFG
jgi:predicted secreted protein